jgi:hypothetical protein
MLEAKVPQEYCSCVIWGTAKPSKRKVSSIYTQSGGHATPEKWSGMVPKGTQKQLQNLFAWPPAGPRAKPKESHEKQNGSQTRDGILSKVESETRSDGKRGPRGPGKPQDPL